MRTRVKHALALACMVAACARADAPARADALADATPGAPPAAHDISSARKSAIVTAAQRVSPAVVSVSVVTTRVVRTDPFGMFRDEFWDRF